MKGPNLVLILAVILISGLAGTQAVSSAAAQWSPPRTSDGQPDIQGYWSGTAGIAAAYDIQDGVPPGEKQVSAELPIQVSKDQAPHAIVDPPDGKIPYQPSAAAIRDENKANSLHPTKLEQIDSLTRCFQMGVPRQQFLGGLQILQSAGYVVIVTGNGLSRTIPLDGRPHIGAGIKLWAGDSVGHWEGNTLVVDVTNINEHGWYDWAGNFHSNYLHLIERWTFTNADTIEYEVTSYDAKVFTKPWTLKNVFVRNKKKGTDAEQWEDACYEGERDVNAILQHNAAEGQK
jgi:hypothetical protein